MVRLPRVLLCGMSVLIGGQVLAATSPTDMPHDSVNPNVEESPGWSESAVKLPPFPVDGDMLAMDLDYKSRFNYSIDQKNLVSNISDGTVRYTLITESDRGTRNVLFESMHCGRMEYKTYAYGNARTQQWRKVKKPQWREIRQGGLNPYHHRMWQFYLCNGFPSRHFTEQEIIDTIKYTRDYESRDEL
ncbi:MAG: CNP1-like family protein [Chromatiales bacterium]|nr:CNP1-like family protein [Chromatiales bacterium]